MGSKSSKEGESKKNKKSMKDLKSKILAVVEIKSQSKAAAEKMKHLKHKKLENKIFVIRKELKTALIEQNFFSAKIKTELLMRLEDDCYIYEITSIFLDELSDKIGLIFNSEEVGAAPNENNRHFLDKIIYICSKLIDIEELRKIRILIEHVLGEKYIQGVVDNKNYVNGNIVNRLSLAPYEESLVIQKMNDFAKEVGIELDTCNLPEIWFSPESIKNKDSKYFRTSTVINENKNLNMTLSLNFANETAQNICK
jgi:hypothetical protein